MTHRATLELDLGTPEAARAVHEAVKLDHEGYATSRVEGSVLHAEADADEVASLLRTVDDLLAAVSTAESVLHLTDDEPTQSP